MGADLTLLILEGSFDIRVFTKLRVARWRARTEEETGLYEEIINIFENAPFVTLHEMMTEMTIRDCKPRCRVIQASELVRLKDHEGVKSIPWNVAVWKMLEALPEGCRAGSLWW